MFPADTADFYQIFLPSKSQPYIKKQEKSTDTMDSIDTMQQKYR